MSVLLIVSPVAAAFLVGYIFHKVVTAKLKAAEAVAKTDVADVAKTAEADAAKVANKL